MRIILAMGHPAHFHLLKVFISKMASRGHILKIIISDKDILRKLLEVHNIEYTIIANKRPNETIFLKAKKLFFSSILLKKIISEFKPDIMLGSLSQPAFVSLFIKTPYIFVGEDDITYTLLQGAITYPFVKGIFAPIPTKVGIFSYKKIPYNGYQKLAYLHPNVFTPDKSLLKNIDLSKPFYLIRLVNLNAYHDVGVKGFSEEILDQLIAKLEKHGKVYISSENELLPRYIKHKLPIAVKNIHHLMYYADIYIGDSQSMAVEAAILGTPSVRFNDFAGKISVLSELEDQYELTFGIKTNEKNKLFNLIDRLLQTPNSKTQFREKRKKMLLEKIDVTEFMVWFFENYPKSLSIVKDNPDYSLRFK